MIGVTFYTGMGRWYNGAYYKKALRKVLVKFKNIEQYNCCNYHFNYPLKPFINKWHQKRYPTLKGESEWMVDDVIAR